MAQNAAQDALVAGAGSETVQTSGSTGNNTYFAGSGNDTMVLGRGNETVVGGSGNATVFGGTGTMTLFAGTGSTLVNGSASGGDTFIASSGNTTIWGGLGAQNTYDVIAGHAGGNLTIDDFRLGTDTLSITGYSATDLASALSGAVTTASGTMLTLSDGTSVTLLGLSHAPSNMAPFLHTGV